MSTPEAAKKEIENQVAEGIRDSMQILSTSDQQSFYDWLTGKLVDPPPVVRGVVTNLASKINVTTGYLTAMTLTRMNKISEFMARAEEIIFNPEVINTKEADEIMKLYMEGQRILSTSMDFARKFLYQNRDMSMSEDVDEVYKMLQSLPPQALRKVRDIIEASQEGKIDEVSHDGE